MDGGWDLIIVGGGVIGLSVAREVAGEGARVLVLERGSGPREASWAAAGMLSPFGEASQRGSFLELARHSLHLWPSYARGLQGETGVELEYRECGKLAVAFTEAGWDRLQERHRWGAPLGAGSRLVGSEALSEEVAGLAGKALGGLDSQADHRVDNRALGEALSAACRLRGVEIRPGSRVRAVVHAGGRAAGVQLADGSMLSGSRILLAAGAWGAQIDGLPSPPPLHPVRGQMLALQPDRLPDPRILESEDVYLVPRDDGRLLVGATVEEVGFQPGLTAGGLATLLKGALRLIPALDAAPVVELWSGFRPATPDRLPILGEDAEVEGVFHASGHFRNGILLAPVTASLMVGWLRGTSSSAGSELRSVALDFSPHRFSAPSTGGVTK